MKLSCPLSISISSSLFLVAICTLYKYTVKNLCYSLITNDGMNKRLQHSFIVRNKNESKIVISKNSESEKKVGIKHK